jgi:glycosyltransferase involved in cell wall biosynthesis
MRHLTALLHTRNDCLRVGRCLETIYPCDEILLVDHGSSDQTVRIAREYGANVLMATSGGPEDYLRDLNPTWILCLNARESLTEALGASLFEWKFGASPEAPAFSIHVREETGRGWTDNSVLETRLVPSSWQRWEGYFPAAELSATALAGDILRFNFP